MKITLLINELNIRGGTHKQFLRLCEYLRSSNVDFEIVTKYYDMEKTYPEFKEFNIKFLKKEKSNYFKNKYLEYLINMIDSLKLLKYISKDSSICNIHDNGLTILFPILSIIGKKIVWQVNDLPGYFSEGNSKGNKSLLFLKFIIRFLFKKITIKFIDKITVNVSKNAVRIKKHLNKECRVYYCGIDSLKNFKVHSWEKKNNIKLLTTGVFFPYRNYETIIKTVEELSSDGYNCTLDIIGETSWDIKYSNKILDLINEKNLTENIKIHGQVSEKDFKLLFDSSDMFLFLNLDQSWGLVVFEAMSVGLPTIVSESVGAVEILNKDVAIIVDPLNIKIIKEQIIKLHNESEFYNNYSQSSLNHVKEMTWDSMYSNKMLKLFNELRN